MPNTSIAAKFHAVALLSIASLTLTGCGPSMTELDRMAGRGSIDPRAPVIAHVQTEINAPTSRVWALLVDAAAWPGWNPAIRHVSMTQPPATQPLASGSRFTWSQSGSTIHSQVQLCEPERRLAWTGTAFTAKAIHAWELSPTPGGHTLVTVHESMDGPLMAQLFPSQKLAESDTAWLASLKKAAEQPR